MSLSPVWLNTTSSNDIDAFGMKFGHRVAQFLQSTGCKARINRKHRDRVIAPGIAQAEVDEVAFINPGGDGHEFDGVHADCLEMLDDGGFGQGSDGAALLHRHIRMALGEAAHIEFIDQLGLVWRTQCKGSHVGKGNGLGHEVCCFSTVARQFGLIAEGS